MQERKMEIKEKKIALQAMKIRRNVLLLSVSVFKDGLLSFG